MARRRRWGSGNVVPPSTPGASWAIRYSSGGRRAYESGFPSETLARQALEARRIDEARGKIGLPPDLSKLPTLAVIGDAWAERRLKTHRAGRYDRGRWHLHLRPVFGELRAPDVDVAAVRAFVERQRASGLKPQTVRLQIRTLSALYEECMERPRETGATGPNPCRGLPASIRLQIRPDHDPRLTPYVEQLRDVERIAAHLAEPIRTGYAVGVLAGLRTGEVIALRWEHVDLDRRQLVVRESVTDGRLGPVKDSEARILPIAPPLLAVLRERRVATGGAGLVLPPAHPGRRSGPSRAPARFARSQTLNAALHAATEALGLRSDLDWYRATRHTYASHYVLGGGSLTHLATLLGHSSAEVTLRYAHLQPAALAEADRVAIDVDLGQRTGRVTRLPDAGDDRKSLGRSGSGAVAKR